MSDTWRFGNVKFEEKSGKLQAGSDFVELDRSCQRILILLLQSGGSSVDKEALLQAGWPGRLVHENSLAKAIGRLRISLGEQGEKLTSVYGHGYRLDVQATRGGVAVWDLAPRAVAAAAPPARKPWFAWGLGAAGMAALGGILVSSESVSGFFTPEYRQTAPVVADAPDAIGKILWVDDNPANNTLEKKFFEDRRIAVHEVTSTADALKLLAIYNYKLVISDMGRGDDRLAGLKLVEQMRAQGDATSAVIYTVRADGGPEQRAQRQIVSEAGAQQLAVTPQEVRSIVLEAFGNPPKR